MKLLEKAIVLMFVLLVFPRPAFAQSVAGMIRASSDVITKNGEIAGCSMGFTVAFADHTYRNGGISVIDGSFDLKMDVNPRLTAKFVLTDFMVGASGTTSRPSAPVNVYLETKSGQIIKSPLKPIESETPGGILTVLPFNSDTVKILNDITFSGNLTLLVSRKIDGRDLRVPLDFGVVSVNDHVQRIRSREAQDGFLRCQSALLKQNAP